MPDLVKIDNRRVAVAVRIARFAATVGQPATVCPFRDDRDPQQRALRRVWLSAYLRINRPGSAPSVEAARAPRAPLGAVHQPSLFGGDDLSAAVAARRDHDVTGQRRDRDGKWSKTGGGAKNPADNADAVGGKSSKDAGEGPLTDAEFADRQKTVEKVVGDARATHATELTETLPGGAWKPERDAIHRQIAADLYAQAGDVPTDGRAVIAGGLGGAGKSTVLRDHAGIDAKLYLTVNPDDIKEEMGRRGLIPDVPGHPELSPLERSPLVHEESSRIAKLLADMAYRDKRNMIWDITMSSQSGVESRVTALRGAGYTDVRGVFVDIPVETSVERALARYRRGVDNFRTGKGLGGRYVPPAIIRAQKTSSGGSMNRTAFDASHNLFDRWSVYDNSVFGRDAQLVDESDGVNGA